jgi:hypothetical protein
LRRSGRVHAGSPSASLRQRRFREAILPLCPEVVRSAILNSGFWYLNSDLSRPGDALRQNPQWVLDLANAIYAAHPVSPSRAEVFRSVALSL